MRLQARKSVIEHLENESKIHQIVEKEQEVPVSEEVRIRLKLFF